MERIAPELRREYERHQAKLKELPQREDCVFSVDDALRAHFLLLDAFAGDGEGYGGVGPRDLKLLYSAIDRQYVEFSGTPKWTTPFEQCATLFFGLTKNHPFHDGNKRTALLSALYYLYQLGRLPSVRPKEPDQNASINFVAEG